MNLLANVRSIGFFLLPSPFAALFGTEADPPQSHNHQRERTAYLDGVRGIAATIVFIEHFALPFYPSIGGSDTGQWSSLQLPIIRVFYSGSFAVCVFFVISGFVLSRRFILLERQVVNHGGASTEEPDRSGLADQLHDAFRSATFRRAPRLFLPSTAIVLLMAALAFFFDAFAAAAEFPGLPRDLFRLDVPRRLTTVVAQVSDCLDFIMSQLIYPFPWMLDIPRKSGSGRPQTYGFHLWTIPVEFWSSEILFVVLMATSLRRRSVRLVIILLASSYSAWCGRWEPPLFLAGALLADLDVSHQIHELPSTAGSHCPTQSNAHTYLYWRNLWGSVGALMCIAGLWIGSMPDYNAERVFGFGVLASVYHFPNIQVYWQGVGAVFFVWSLQYCGCLRRLFELRLLQYMGDISFALYLVHLPIVTIFGWSMTRLLLDIVGKGFHNLGWDREVLIIAGCLITFTAATWAADICWRAFDAASVALSKRLDTSSSL